MPSQVEAFILSKSKRIMNKFISVTDGLKTYIVNYQDTDSLCTEKKHWDKLDEAGLAGKR